MRKVVSYSKRIWLWLSEGSLVFWTITVIALDCGVAIWLRTEWGFRYAGLALQLLGIGTVVYGIWNTRSLFGQPTLRERFHRWLNRRPKYGQETTIASGFSATGEASASAEAELWMDMSDDASVEQQLKALKHNLLTVSERVNKVQAKFAAEIHKGAQELNDEKAARTQRDAEIETLVRNAQTGGLDLSFVGVIWLAFGLLLTTASIEAEKFMAYLLSI